MASKSLGYSVTAVDQASRTFVAMAVQVERLAKRLDQLDGKRASVTVDANTDPAQRKIETLDKSFGAATIRIAALGRAMGTLALPGAIIAATPAIASLGQSAVTASGALWLLPAAATAGGIAMAALKVGMAGFGEAMKNLGDPEKFAEAIAKLSPAAREAATTIRSLVPAWTAMQSVVQENLFAGVAAQIGELARTYLPILQTGLDGVATSLNASALGLAAWAQQAAVIGTVQQIFANVGAAMSALAPAATSIASIFLDIAAVGATFLPGLASGFANAAASAAVFVANARATGQLAVWIANGLEQLRLLGALSMNVGSILGSVFGAAAASGESFLGMLVRVTGQMATALKTPEGAAGLQTFFETVRTLAGLFWDRLVQLWPVVVAGGEAFAALAIAAAPVLDILFGLVTSALVPLLDTIKEMAPVLGPVLGVFAGLGVVAKLAGIALGGLKLVMGGVNVAVGLFKLGVIVVRGAIVAWTAVQWLLNAALRANPIGLVVTAIGLLVAGLIYAWQNSETFRAIVIGAWEAIKAAAVAVFTWLGNFLATVWNGIVAAVTTAWGGIVNFLSTAWNAITAGFTTAVDFLVGLWNTFWNGLVAVATAVWNGITAAVQGGWDLITGAFNFAIGLLTAFWDRFWRGLQNIVGFVWTGITAAVQFGWDMITAGFNAAVGFLTGLWDRFWRGLQVIAGAVWAGIQAVVSTAWAVISDAFNAAVGFLADVWNRFWNGLRAVATAVWDAISAFFAGAFGAFRTFFTTVWDAIAAVFDAVWNRMRQGVINIWNAIAGFFSEAFNAFRAFFTSVWDAVAAVFDAVWNRMRQGVINIWNAIAGFFSAAFSAFQGFFSTVWDAVAAFFLGVWTRIRDTAVNLWNTIAGFFGSAFAAYQAFFATVWNTVADFFLGVWNRLRDTAVNLWNAIAAFFGQAFAAFQNFFATVWNTIVDFFVGTWNRLRDTATAAWNFIKDFFAAQFAAFTTGFTNVWNNIVATFDRIWSSIVGIAERVWGAVRGAFVGGVNVIIDIINGFAGAINRVAGLLGFNINLGIPRLNAGGEIDAVRRALGGEIEMKQVIRRASGGGVDATNGGRLPATGTLRDTLPALAGRQPYLLQGREWIVRSGASRALGADKMAMVNNADRRPVDVVPRNLARYAQGGPLDPIAMASAGQIAAAASALVPGSRMSSGFRPGDPGYHGRNQAADMVGNFSAINRAWAERYGAGTNELIYTPGINLLNGRPHTYGAATQADHYDHVHIAYSGALGEGEGGGVLSAVGGFFQSLLRPVVEGLLSPLRNMIVPIRDDAANGFGKRMVAGTGVKLIDFLVGKAAEQDAAAAASAAAVGPTSNEAPGIVRIISDVARQFGVGFDGAVIGTATGLVESGLRNLNYGDRDSVGVFQQRPSQGWGSVGQIMNVSYAAGKFFEGLTRFNWRAMDPGAAAQRVQRSAFPGRYSQRMGQARGLVQQHGGFDRGGVAEDRGYMWKETIKPERILSPRQTESFERLTDWLDSPAAQRLLAIRPGQFPALNPALAAAGQLRRGRGGGVTVRLDDAASVAELTRLRSDVQALQRVVREARPVNLYPPSGDGAEIGQAVSLRLRM